MAKGSDNVKYEISQHESKSETGLSERHITPNCVKSINENMKIAVVDA